MYVFFSRNAFKVNLNILHVIKKEVVYSTKQRDYFFLYVRY